MPFSEDRSAERSRFMPSPALGAVALAASFGAGALINDAAARRAERAHPPTGRMIHVQGVRLHVFDSGRRSVDRPVILLLHGNGACFADWQASGLIDRLAATHRVIAPDRPGFGHSARPHNVEWTPEAEADLFAALLEGLGVERAIVVGHSWAALIAAAFGLRHPAQASKIVLASGYYFPTARADFAFFSAPALPVVGDMLRHTVSPLVARAIAKRIVRTIFAPRPVPERFWRLFPLEMCFRPSQIRASAEESAMMVPAARRLAAHYGEIGVPVEIVTGDDDRVCDPDRQSAELARAIPRSRLEVLPDVGHMIHYAPEAQTRLAEVIMR
jgi:pimeloyl-ACP methyl ester carboxylesterase